MLTRDKADEELRRLSAQQDTMGAALVELEEHVGRRLLESAALTGLTKQRWQATKVTIATLWDHFTAYQKAVDAAGQLRQRHRRPGDDELAELTRLLAGPSVELARQDVALPQRSLTGPATVSERLTLDEAVSRMNAMYAQATEVVAAADAVWSAVLPRLDGLDAAMAEIRQKATGLGAIDLDRIDRELTATRQTAMSDPLSLWRDGAVDVGALTRLEADVAALASDIATAARLRDRFEARVTDLGVLVERLHTTETEVARTAEEVRTEIAAPVAPGTPVAARLRGRLQDLAARRAEGNWLDQVGDVTQLEADLTSAIAAADARLAAISSLLRRRDELRGRLDGYRAKARRLGRGEDPELDRRYRRARSALWTTPCDLTEAAAAVTEYQTAITADPGRPHP